MSQSRRSALGRGLSALIPDAPRQEEAPRTGLMQIPIDRISRARHQPRTVFDETALAELTASIASNGLLQPIVVRETGPERYVIVAGERRFRASKRAGLDRVPVVVRDVTDAEAFELALIENVQRADLSPLEEAEAYRHLSEQGWTQEEIARRVGKDRATVSNALRLLRLPEAVRALVAAGALTAGHARALLTAPADAQVELAQAAVAGGWSVRETERRARAAREAAQAVAEKQQAAAPTAGQQAVEAQLRAALGAPVRLVNRRGKGRIEIRFHSLGELERLLDLISGLEGR